MLGFSLFLRVCWRTNHREDIAEGVLDVYWRIVEIALELDFGNIKMSTEYWTVHELVGRSVGKCPIW